MRRTLFALPVISLLTLAACGASKDITIKNSNGRILGTIDVQGTHTASILNGRGEVAGKVRGTVIRDASGKHIGTIAERDAHIVLEDGDNNAVGTLEKGTECYGKGQDILGTISMETDPYAAAAGCLVFFLQ